MKIGEFHIYLLPYILIVQYNLDAKLIAKVLCIRYKTGIYTWYYLCYTSACVFSAFENDGVLYV